MNRWQDYCDKFLNITAREQYLIIATGVFVVFFTFYNLYLESALEQVKVAKQQISQTKRNNLSAMTTIQVLEDALQNDPNAKVEKSIKHKERELAMVDEQLLTLTSDLIDPVQMRSALMQLLALQKGVSLLSFEALPAKALTKSDVGQTEDKQAVVAVLKGESANEMANEVAAMVLYKHGMRLTLSGSYFQLRDYLTKVEALNWTFFWQSFHYELVEYPKSQLVIEIYSLSTNKEFIGV